MADELFAGVQAETKDTLADVLDAVAPFTCDQCGDVIHLEADERPLGDQEDILCDDCYHEHYEFTCCWCEEYEHIDYQHGLLVVFDAEEAGLDLAGLYRIDDYPLTWLGPFTGRAEDQDGYPCGHLCRECQPRAVLRIADERYALRCGVAALGGA